MKKITAILLALVLFSMVAGFQTAGGLQMIQPAKASFTLEVPVLPFPDLPIFELPTPTPRPTFRIDIPIGPIIDLPIFDFPTVTTPTLPPVKTPAPTSKPTDAPTHTPAKATTKPTAKPSSGGGKLMNSEGPLFLSFQTNLTDKLLMFTPMDLSMDGVTAIPLIGNEHQVVGEAKVTVQAGMVTVSYLLVNGVKVDPDNEFLTFFPDIRSVPSVEPRKLQDMKLKFGIPYNIASWLGSDPKVLLYIDTPVSYKNDIQGLSPFSFQDEAYLQRMMASLPLMD